MQCLPAECHPKRGDNTPAATPLSADGGTVNVPKREDAATTLSAVGITFDQKNEDTATALSAVVSTVDQKKEDVAAALSTVVSTVNDKRRKTQQPPCP